jgi:hypothetical protein
MAKVQALALEGIPDNWFGQKVDAIIDLVVHRRASVAVR